MSTSTAQPFYPVRVDADLDPGLSRGLWLLGLNRWVLRVAGYVALMTDRYSPFALDQGGHGPGPSAAMPHHTPPPSGTERPGWTAGRIVSLVLGSLLVAGGLGLAGGGAILVGVDQLGRDADGFLTSPRQELTSDGFAITSEPAEVHTDDTVTRLPEAVVGDVRISARGADDASLFVGIAPAADVERYLADVRHHTLLEIRDGEPVYRSTGGNRGPATPPAAQDFWVAEATGADPEVVWTLGDGDWTVVVMNTDGAPAVRADVSAGAEVPLLSTLIAVLFVAAGLALIAGALLIAIPARLVNRSS